MSVEPRQVTKTEVSVGWENQVVNGTYPLKRFLGGSNHSEVFLTEYRLTEHGGEGVLNAAIKLMPADSLQMEAQLLQWGSAATLAHPHLLRMFDAGHCDMGGRAFLFVVMEYADQTLAQILPRRALSPEEIREMLLPISSALNFLHSNNLVQGQVKPTNILAVGDQLKLASDRIRPAGQLSSGVLRTSLYDPPELQDGEIAPAGDVWGLGVTLVESLTQHPPTWSDRSETVSLLTSIPPLFAETVKRCLNRIPGNRPSAAELERLYNPAAHPHPITVIEAEGPIYDVATEELTPPPVPASHAHSRLGVLVPAVLAVLILVLGVSVSRTILVRRGGMQGTVAPNAAAPGTAAHSAAPRSATGRPVAAPTAAASARAGPSLAATTAIPQPSDQTSSQQPEMLGSILHQQLPDVPRPIREKIRGHVNVTVRVLVDPAGNVVGEFFENAGPDRYLARLAGDAAGDWKFVPTDQNGSRVWLLRFEFSQADVAVRMIGMK